MEQLAGLCRAWGAIKYKHSGNDTDLDKALIDTMPLIDKAQTSKEYEDAINHLFSYVGPDKPTTKLNQFKSTEAQIASLMYNPNSENPYPDMVYPSREYRLLGAFRFWNVIRYYYPYKELLDYSWDSVLPDLIRNFEQAKNAQEYALAAASAASKIQDTHGFAFSTAGEAYFGTGKPAIVTRTIEGKVVITQIFDRAGTEAKQQLKIGDIILAVDNEPIEQRRSRLTPYLPASTPQALEWRLNRFLLRGPKDSQAKLTVGQASGKIIDVEVPRTDDPYAEPKSKSSEATYTVLPSGYGYVDLTRLTLSHVDRAFEKIKDTPAVIFDLRGYPKYMVRELAAHLSEKRTSMALIESEAPTGSDSTPVQRVGIPHISEPSGKPVYKGRVIVLVDENARSRSEHTAIVIEAATEGKAIFVGSPTNGANGDVTRVILPGSIGVAFSGLDIRHADGRQLQRVGIQPEIRVEPTIAGIRAGKDEVLDRAVRYLQNKNRRVSMS